ncbi:lipoprotein [Shewanella rhizosphaerae]|uniref:LPS translocon maturation chaperone LptM n=1 Tax=Shewanella rhizosphaerae TaxID=2864207 RepID=UPI001C656F55|nr:lipoprotein [Shewanella rhizosphaerae]QYK13249.1 lipoprotein [Shewanella rhizosphaerae]
MLNKMKLILLMLLASAVLSGCGQKGPLYKSPAQEDNQKPQVEQPTPATEQNNNKD